jgi:hypothetical protein
MPKKGRERILTRTVRDRSGHFRAARLAAALALALTAGSAAAPARTAARPQSSTAAPPITTSLRALEQLLQRSPAHLPGSPAVGDVRAEAHRRAEAALRELLRLSASWPAQSPENYRLNLARTVESAAAAVQGEGGPARLSALEALADDLETKLEHCVRSGGKLGGAVLVRVRTVQASGEARRWQVLYMPRILAFSTAPVPDVFPQLSSPTDERLVPGRYLMWARNPVTGLVGERTLVKVGEGRKELVLDLPVPAEPAK